MPNWCFDQVIFEGDLNSLIALQTDLTQALKTIEEGDRRWIGRLLMFKGIDYKDIEIGCRSFIDHYSSLEEIETSKHFYLYTEGAWSPVTEMYDWIAETYDLDYVLWAEEPGMEIFVNTDVECKHFPERYYVSCDDGLDDCYFETLKGVAEALKKELNLPATPEMTLEELNELDDDVFIYEFETAC